jgi:hypothetical protein
VKAAGTGSASPFLNISKRLLGVPSMRLRQDLKDHIAALIHVGSERKSTKPHRHRPSSVAQVEASITELSPPWLRDSKDFRFHSHRAR